VYVKLLKDKNCVGSHYIFLAMFLIPESVKIGYRSCLKIIFVKIYTVVAVAWVCHSLVEYLGI
jgi:hypothetical protein